MAVSIKDVAIQAGVSVATVSYVLNSSRKTRLETRHKVLAAAEQLGFTINQSARALVRGQNDLFGLLISDIRNPFFPEVTASFQDQALLHQMDAIVLSTNYDLQRTLICAKRLAGLRVAGVAVLTSQVDPSIVQYLRMQQIPAVYLDLGRVDVGIGNIGIPYEDGIGAAVGHLCDLGHKHIAFIGGTPGPLSSIRRKRGFQAAMEKARLRPFALSDADFTVRGGYQACAQLLADSRPTAIVAANDLMAIGALSHAFDRGLSVPGEISITGFDNIAFSKYTHPALTTVSVAREEIGRLAFKALVQMISAPDAPGGEYQTETHLVVRQSTRAVTEPGRQRRKRS